MRFHPPWYLRSPHIQTVLGSRLTQAQELTNTTFEANADTRTLNCSDGVRLQALTNHQLGTAPLVVLIHGWLGCADSTYIRRTAKHLANAGYNVARLLLRDHGDTTHLNQQMFHSARLREVIDACNQLAADHHQCAIVGFSLGGNFALRLGAHAHLDSRFQVSIAICPAVNPATAALAIDSGWFGYRWYFVRRWQQALRDKAAAFPEHYDFSQIEHLDTVAALTDYFATAHTEFSSAAAYYAAYQVTADTLNNAQRPLTLVTAADDPIIPVDDLRPLQQHRNVDYLELDYGGHCSFVNDLRGRSPLNLWLVEHLNQRFQQDTQPAGSMRDAS